MTPFRWLAKSTALIAALSLLHGGMAAAQSRAAATPGFGNDERRPQGAPLQLPPGLKIAGPIVGADDDGNCPKPRTATVGSGLMVRACLPVKNMTGGPVTAIFPPGLVIVSASETFQNGVLVERETVTVPPIEAGGGGQLLDDKNKDKVTYIPLHLYCLNSGKEGSTPDARYELGPVTQHAGLSELYRWMEGRDFKNDRDRVEVLQSVVWDVIKSGRLTQQNREDLERGWYASGESD